MLNIEKMLMFICCILTVILLFVIIEYVFCMDNYVSQQDDNNQEHYVVKGPDQMISANLLAEIKTRIQYLIDFCLSDSPTSKNIQLLQKRFNPKNIRETSLTDKGTSYTIDKGKELHLCLRDKQTLKHHDINILMFVVIHELAHIMSISYGHNSEFTDNFRYLLKKAIECNVYRDEDYGENPVNFCGITVKNNPLH
jgi:predicted SprT family Zn-dependent metalloprotease